MAWMLKQKGQNWFSLSLSLSLSLSRIILFEPFETNELLYYFNSYRQNINNFQTQI